MSYLGINTLSHYLNALVVFLYGRAVYSVSYRSQWQPTAFSLIIAQKISVLVHFVCVCVCAVLE